MSGVIKKGEAGTAGVADRKVREAIILKIFFAKKFHKTVTPPPVGVL